ncbi:hypothetical protein PR202_gb09082 [Eleusine coracana subsp. coracana]|uniref:GDSL esterase/lipase n=1 Tax=Eleusine coracana subsp. coracana TaxID=191504 RepID=A0AAV5EGA1_ELECO|nr:hypothetical protein PR202_gb09082 [Eleusine coracana subsp. coracana]
MICFALFDQGSRTCRLRAGQGPYNGIGLCTAASNVCADRDAFAFWDAFHPSERANRIIVGQIMHGDTDYMHPMNLSTILAVDREGLI